MSIDGRALFDALGNTTLDSPSHYYKAKFGKNQEFCPPKSKLGLSSHGVHGKNLWVLLLFSQRLGHSSPQPVDNDLTSSRKVVKEKVSISSRCETSI